MLTLLLRDEELCRFGASSYLYYGGVFSLVVNLLGLASSLAKWLGHQLLRWNHFYPVFFFFKTRWALKDGKISVSERRLLWFLGVSTSIMLLADLIVVIWVNEQIHILSSCVLTVPPSRDQLWFSATTPGGATRTQPLPTIALTLPCSLPSFCYL